MSFSKSIRKSQEGYSYLNANQLTQLDRLKNEYRFFVERGAASSKILDEIVDESKHDLTLSDLETLDVELVQYRQLEALKNQLSAVKQSLTVASPTFPTDFLNACDDNEANLRTSITIALRETYKSNFSKIIQERTRSAIIGFGAMIGFIATLAFVVLVILQARGTTSGYVHPLLLFALAGFIGGIASVYKPLMDINSDQGSKAVEALQSAKLLFIINPVNGVIFALVVTMLIVGGILTGPAFPKTYTAATFSGSTFPVGKTSAATAAKPTTSETGVDASRQLAVTADARDQQKYFQNAFIPATGEDFALFIVWCFLAGFAGSMVPTMLATVSQKQSSGSARNP